MRLVIGPAVNATTTTTTTPVPVCQVYAAGNYVGNCQALYSYFAPAPWYTDFWIGLLIALVGTSAFLAIRVYYEYPFGRFFWKKKGLKAVMHFQGSPGVLGQLYPYLEKVFLFISSGSERKKNRIIRLIPAVPGAITHLRQEDGGDSFALIEGDKGLPVSAELVAWAEKNLNELADSHDWNRFALKTKYDLLARAIAEAKLFPMIKDWNPGTETVTLLAEDNITLYHKEAIKCTDEEKSWYIKTSAQAATFLKDTEEQQAKTLAILNGEDFYVQSGQKIPLPPRKKTEWVEKITAELANLKGEVGRAVLGGSLVSTQFVASVLSNTPNGVYFDSARAEIEEKIRKELKKKGDEVIKAAIAAVIVMGGIAIILVVMSKYLG